jgi:hypothetical protein
MFIFPVRKTGVERRLFWSIPVPDNKKLVFSWSKSGIICRAKNQFGILLVL